MLASPAPRFVLGSRSPRRRELLSLIVPAERIEIVPPRSTDEAGFEGLADLDAIRAQIGNIARTKCEDVLAQLGQSCGIPPIAAVICADTDVVVADAQGRPLVLGQPPDDDSWPAVVRHWFREYYAGKTHRVLTGLCVMSPGGERREQIVETRVTFTADVERQLDWYLETGEPRGKAGGYALQGAGSVFITDVAGSLSNVIGLPLEALLEVFRELRIGL